MPRKPTPTPTPTPTLTPTPEPTPEPSPDGKVLTPGESLQQSLTSLRPGDTLYLRSGRYLADFSLTVAAGTAEQRILVAAYPGEHPIIEGNARLIRPSFWTIKGLEFTAGVTAPPSYLLSLLAGDGWVVEGCEVHGHPTMGAMHVGRSSVHGAPKNWILRGNYLHDSNGSNLYCNPARDNVNGLIERNVFWNAASPGANIKVGWGGTGVDVPGNGAASMVIRYNTAYSSIMPMLVAEATAGVIEVYRNIFVRNTRSAEKHAVRLDSVEGYLKGDIRVYDNLAWDTGGVFISDLNGLGPVKPADVDKGGNRFLDPRFNHTNDRSGFRPQELAAQAYGVTA